MWAVAAACSLEASVDIAIYFELVLEHIWTNLYIFYSLMSVKVYVAGVSYFVGIN